VVAAGAGGDLLGFVGAQRARGLQLEAVPATAFVIIRMFGDGETARYEYGSLQFGDTAARAVAVACSLVEIAIVVLAVLRWWLARPRPATASGPGPATPSGPGPVAASGPGSAAAPGLADLAGTAGDRLLALLLVVLVTSRVLSPQYLVWVLAVASTLVALRATGPADGPLAADPAEAGRQADRRAVLVLLLVAAAISQVIYPWRYNDLIQGRPATSLLLLARNVLLLAACWRAVRVTEWRPAVRVPPDQAPAGDRTDPPR
jgi:hypothetical protein